MAWQLIFTSVARGLNPGQSGYCTVARSRDLREGMIPRLEGFSYYTHEKDRPVICAHRIVELRGVQYHVLSRIVDAGLDFTKRRKFLAHHLVFEPGELGATASPALVFLKWSGWKSDWEGEPVWLPELPGLNLGEIEGSAWTEIVGSRENVVALREGWISGVENVRDRFLALLHESLVAQGKPWGGSFTNWFQPGDEVNDFGIRAVWPETAGWEWARQLGAEIIPLKSLRAAAATKPVEEPVQYERTVAPAPAPAKHIVENVGLGPLWIGVAVVAAGLVPAAFVFFQSESRPGKIVPTAVAEPSLPSSLSVETVWRAPQRFLIVSANAQTASVAPEVEAKLKALVIPKGAELALGPREYFAADLEGDFSLGRSLVFEFAAVRAQIEAVIALKEKEWKLREVKVEDLSKKAERQRDAGLTNSLPEAVETLNRLEGELKALKEKAARLPKDFGALGEYSVYLCEGDKRVEIVRFEKEGR